MKQKEMHFGFTASLAISVLKSYGQNDFEWLKRSNKVEALTTSCVFIVSYTLNILSQHMIEKVKFKKGKGQAHQSG